MPGEHHIRQKSAAWTVTRSIRQQDRRSFFPAPIATHPRNRRIMPWINAWIAINLTPPWKRISARSIRPKRPVFHVMPSLWSR